MSAALMVGVPAISAATHYVTTCLLRDSLTMVSNSCPSRLIFEFGAEIAPKQLPRHKTAPVAVTIHGAVSTDDGSQPSALREMTIDFDRNVAINAAGLPVCKRGQLNETRGNGTAERICHMSIIGTGTAHVAISSKQRLIHLPLTLFNGGVKGGVTTLFVRSSIAVPTLRPILSTVELRKVHEGRYGLRAVSKIPRIVDGSGRRHVAAA